MSLVKLFTYTVFESGTKVVATVKVATTSNGTLASSFANGQTVDGITLATGDIILIKNQSGTNASENGIYKVKDSGFTPENLSVTVPLIKVTKGTSNTNKYFLFLKI